MALSAETLQRIDILRQKARAGQSTLEDMREAVKLMREDRVGAATASANSRAKKAKAATPLDGDALLKDFM